MNRRWTRAGPSIERCPARIEFGLSTTRRASRCAERLHGPSQSGAALVEFAVLAPLLFLLILGIIEFGWTFAQFNDVRHGAREGARFAAVDSGDVDAIRDRVCQSMTGLDANMSAVTVDLLDGGAAEGDLATITVTATIERLLPIPLLDFALPSTLTSEVDFRLEDDLVNWSAPSSIQRSC